MRPLNWRCSKEGDPDLTDDGVKYCNSVLFHRGDKVIECKLGVYQLDNLEIFDLPRGHPGWNPVKLQRGVRPFRPIPADTIVGFYAGVYRPGSFADENPYVFGVQPIELDLVIDALVVGNITRYINDPKGTGHEANLEAEDVIIQQGAHTVRCVQFRSLREILIGEELLFEYEATVKGYWNQFRPEIIDLTIIPDDALIVKRERLQLGSAEPLQKKSRVRWDSSIEIVNSSRVKDLIFDVHPLKLIRLSSNWNIELTLPKEFDESQMKDIEMDLLKFDAKEHKFVTCSPMNMFQNKVFKDGFIRCNIIFELDGRIKPFPRTSLRKRGNVDVMAFSAKSKTIKAISPGCIIVGNDSRDYDETTWSQTRREFLMEVLQLIFE